MIQSIKILKLKFNYFNSYLKSVSWVAKKPNKIINNSNLKSAASRISVPRPFDPYVRYIENSTNKPFPKDMLFTTQEVEKEDNLVIERFSHENFDISKLNLDRLLSSALLACEEMGLPGYSNIPKVPKIGIAESASRFPRNTSAGYPYFKRKDNKIAFFDAVEWSQRNLENPNLFDFLEQPTAIFHRFQYKVKSVALGYSLRKKIRPVWGVPFRVVTLEGVFFRSIVDSFVQFQHTTTQPCSTAGMTKKQISEKFVKPLRSFKKDIISVDFVKFDSLVPNFMWSLFYACILDCLETDSKDLDVLKCLMVYHCYTPFCYKSTRVRYSLRGVPSGALITNLFDTWVNRVIYNYSCLESTKDKYFPNGSSSSLGDDLIFVEVSTTLPNFISVCKRFGMELEIDPKNRSKYFEEFMFIGYYWDDQNRPTQKELWYIAHLCLPSRFLKVDKIPLSVLQTYRGITLCMSLYRGMEYFEKLVGYADTIWIQLLKDYNSGKEPIIHYVGEDQRFSKLRIPLSVIFHEGWESL